MRLMMEIDIEADGSRSAWVGMPKQGGTKVRLELGPVDDASLLVDAASSSRGKGAAAKWAGVNTKLGTNLVEYTSDHFTVYTDFAEGKAMARGCEVVYAGFTPSKDLGATEQHSQVQIYREGPNDKVFAFLEVEDFDADITIPAGLGVESLSYLEGASMTTLLNSEKRATEQRSAHCSCPVGSKPLGQVGNQRCDRSRVRKKLDE